MPSGYERAVAFGEALRARCVERVVPFRFGRALFNDSLRLVWDLNLLRVDDPEGATMTALVEEADRLHGEAGHEHRHVSVPHDRAGEELAEGFRALGWRSECFLLMDWHGGGTRTADTSDVEEADGAAVRALREMIVREQPWAAREEVVRMVVDASELAGRAGNARHFVVRVDGEVAAAADLYSDGRTAQVEDVATLERHRGRGLASAVVLRAVEEALAAGHDFVFLVADDEDWPKELYARLGFGPLGRTWSFLKTPS
jgi:GNAT superfamily N-acetyltransferase